MMIGLFMLVAAGRAVLYDTIDPDCFWHLRVADQLVSHGIGPITDDFSYASKAEPWTPYSWFAELAMKAIWSIGGFRAAIVVHAVNSALIILLIALSCAEAMRQQRIGINDDDESNNNATGELSIVFATAFGAFFTLAYLSFRPASFAILLLALIGCILLRNTQRQGKPADDNRWVWTVIGLTLVLTNVHLYAFLVPAWIGAFAVGAWWERRFDAARKYAYLAIACGVACLMTPMLPGVVRTIVHYQFADDMVSGPVIDEMQPFYSGPLGKAMLILSIAFAICVWRNRARLDAGHRLRIVIGAALLLQLGRFAPLFAIVASPALAVALPRFSGRVLRKPAFGAILSVVIAMGVVRVACAFPYRQSFDQWVNRHAPEAPGYPCSAAAYVEANVRPASGRIINEFTWGGYLEWRLQGRFRVLMDGRTQVYPSAFWHATYLGDDAQRRRVLIGARADAAIVPAQKGIFGDLLRELGWTTAYEDAFSMVLLPPEAAVVQGD